LADAPWGTAVPKPGTAVVVDCARDAVSARLDLGGEILQLAVDEDSGIVFATCADARLRLIRDTTMAAVLEPQMTSSPRSTTPTVVRGVLSLPRSLHPSLVSVLLDISGRRVMSLLPGPNDVRHLAPGVYFVREQSVFSSQHSGRDVSRVTKVIVTE
jgi:hypothetical protein